MSNKCVACNNSTFSYETFGKFQIKKCNFCGLGRTTPIPKENIITDENFKYRLKNIELWNVFNLNIIKIIMKYFKTDGNKLLDIGCNIGLLVKLANTYQFDALGIDIDKKAVNFGNQNFGLKLQNKKIAEANLKDSYFDVITLIHTLEHVRKFEKLIKLVNKKLKNGGLLVIQVPYSGGLIPKIQKLRGKIWYGYDFENHVWHFSIKALKIILERNNFSIREIIKKENLHYDKTNSLIDFLKETIQYISLLLQKGDQLTIVAEAKKWNN